MVEFQMSGAPIDRATISQMEHELGFQFPREFISLYLAQNGGMPLPSVYKREKEFFMVSEFFSLSDQHNPNSFERVFRDLKVDKKILPEFLIPFADDPGGDFYCFSTRSVDFGSIWIFRGDYFDDPERASQYVCGSLAEFLDGLVSEDEMDE